MSSARMDIVMVCRMFRTIYIYVWGKLFSARSWKFSPPNNKYYNVIKKFKSNFSSFSYLHRENSFSFAVFCVHVYFGCWAKTSLLLYKHIDSVRGREIRFGGDSSNCTIKNVWMSNKQNWTGERCAGRTGQKKWLKYFYYFLCPKRFKHVLTTGPGSVYVLRDQRRMGKRSKKVGIKHTAVITAEVSSWGPKWNECQYQEQEKKDHETSSVEIYFY